jgi:hypothetical protein
MGRKEEGRRKVEEGMKGGEEEGGRRKEEGGGRREGEYRGILKQDFRIGMIDGESLRHHIFDHHVTIFHAHVSNVTPVEEHGGHVIFATYIWVRTGRGSLEERRRKG